MAKGNSVKMLAHTFGEDNANRFLKAGWTFLDSSDSSGQFTKYNFAWTKSTKPVYPNGIANPLTKVVNYIDAEIKKVKQSIKKKDR